MLKPADDHKTCAAKYQEPQHLLKAFPQIGEKRKKKELEQHFLIASASGLPRNYAAPAARQAFLKTSPKDAHAISSW